MKDKKLSILFIVALLLSLCLPTILWIKDYFIGIDQRINSAVISEYATLQGTIIGFFSLILNFALVIIAYKAFKNFDVKKQFHNKQLEIVSELSTAISSAELSNMFYKGSTAPNGEVHQIMTGYTLSFYEIALAFDYSKFELICVRSSNIENTFPFLKYRRNPLLPKRIAKALDKLYRPLQYSITVKPEKLKMDYVLLYTKHIDKDDISKDWKFEIYKTPAQFTEDAANLRSAIIEWFKEYGADDLNI